MSANAQQLPRDLEVARRTTEHVPAQVAADA
jgi:hypothetical protein